MLVGADIDDTKLLAALAMAERGMRVFPVRPGPAKEPMVKDWPNTATLDRDTITAIWTKYPHANIGVLCDNHIVIDVDVKKGKQGLASLMDLDIDLNTFTVRTPSGGLHVYYTGPNVRNSVERALGSGLDVRSYHGYVLGPGSTINGVPYRVDCDRPIMDAGHDLAERLLSGRTERADRTGAPVSVLDTLAAIDRATHFLRDEASLSIEGQGGDHTAFLTAAAVKDFGVSQDMAFDLMAQHWNDRCSPPWEVHDLRTKIHNAYHYGSLPPGISAPEHQFGAVSIAPETKGHGPWFHHGDQIAFDQSWLFYNVLPAVGVALVTGPSGSGKTFLTTALAHALATGKPFFGVEPDDKGATLFLSAGTEGSGLDMRLLALGERDRLPIAARSISTALAGGNALVELQAEIEAKAADMLAEYGVPVRMVVFETLSASGLLKDENDNAEASAAVVALGKMARRMGCLFVTTHHPPKTGNGSRGAGALEGAVDLWIEIQREAKAPVRSVDLRKARNASERTLGAFTLQPVILGQDRRGRDITSCVVSMGERQELGDERMSKNAELVLSCIEFALVDAQKKNHDVTEVAAETVRNHFWERTSVKIGPNGERNNQNTAFRKALQWLVDMNRVASVTRDQKEWIREKEPIE